MEQVLPETNTQHHSRPKSPKHIEVCVQKNCKNLFQINIQTVEILQETNIQAKIEIFLSFS